MKFTLNGTVYEFAQDRLLVAEARAIKTHAGMGIADWNDGLKRGDPDALVAMVFIAKKRAGEATRWQDLDEVDLIALMESIDAGDEEAEDEAPPTMTDSGPTGTTPNPESSNTSPLSDTSTDSTPGTSTDSPSPSSTPTP